MLQRENRTVSRPRNSMILAASGIAVLFAAASLRAATTVPEGTVLPARLDSTLSSKKAKPGQIVTARIMQDVPLPQGKKIPAGAKLVGKVTGATPATNTEGGSISVRFDTLRLPHEHVLLGVHLRAIASFLAVHAAQVPLTGSDRGIPETAWNTIQIGGDVVYRGGGHVRDRNGIVGEPVENGALGPLRENRDEGCDSSDAPQALWLFSSNACGVYGLPDLLIAHAGRTDPAGEITLRSKKGDVKVDSGGGLLLRVNGSGDPQT
jgi:hypothetical protein